MAGASTSKATAAVAKRSDPRPRRASGIPNNAVKSSDPDRTYVYASPSHQDVGSVSYYEALGYTIETYRADGPAIVGGRMSKPGEPMTYMDQVLMSIDKDAKDEIEQFGPDGDSGQAHADVIERSIYNRKAARRVFEGIDGLRGKSGEPVFDVDAAMRASRGNAIV